MILKLWRIKTGMTKKKLSKKEKLAMCGVESWQTMDSNGVPIMVFYHCGLRDCPHCAKNIMLKKKRAVSRLIAQASKSPMYIIELPSKSVRGFKNKIRGDNYYAAPQDGKEIILVDQLISYAGTASKHITYEEAMMLFTDESNINTPKRRSTGGEWSLKEEKNKEAEVIDGEVTYRMLIPFLKPPEGSLKEDHAKYMYELSRLRASCTVWKSGVLDPHDDAQIQAFVDYKMSAFCEMAIRAGFVFDKDRSFVKEKTVKRSEVTKWVGVHFSAQLEFFNENSKKVISTISPQLLPILTGNEGMKNWREEIDKENYPEWFIDEKTQEILDNIYKIDFSKVRE